jgi:hypothetical protein
MEAISMRGDDDMPRWPAIPYPEWRETCTLLHLCTQIVGKYRLSHTPWLNHSWHATLYVSPRGLTTGPVPDGPRSIVVEFDLHDHSVTVESSDGRSSAFPLRDMSVAAFLDEMSSAVGRAGGTFDIHRFPNEVAAPVAFETDTEERPWDREAVARFHAALVQIERVFSKFRTGFVGKVSPVHLFWGSFDLAVTRFSGRRAPPHPGGIPSLPDAVTREAYSHEVSSAGFWPGGNGVDEAMFYSYAYPVPDGFADRVVEPAAARFDEKLGEFLLPYAAIRDSADPDGDLIRFLETTYAAAADTADWDRAALDCGIGRPLVPRSL